MTKAGDKLLAGAREALEEIRKDIHNLVLREKEPAQLIAIRSKIDAALTRPTPAERPVPQVREALEEAPRPWSFEEGGDDMLPCIGDADGNILMQIHLDPYGSPRIEQKMAAMKMAVQAVNAALTARPSDAAVAVQDTWFTDSTLPIMGMSGDIESDRVLRLLFRRAVTDSDRARLIEVLNAGEAALALPPDEPAPGAIIEECAKVAEGHGTSEAVRDICKIIAKAIRALAPARVTPSSPRRNETK